MIYIPIAINNKVASVPCGTYIVADNTDYVLSFTFDAEWNGYPQKTARILIGSQYSDIDFTGNTVTIPPIASNAASILVGVYADGIATTTPATVHVFASVLGSTGTEYEPVDPTVLPDAPEVAADDTITITDVSEGARAKATIGQIADVVAPLIPEQAARFNVTYNETPFASILAAYNNNKVVVLTMSDNEIPLHSISSTKATFVGFNPESGGTNAEKISVTSSNVWSYGVFDYYTTEDVDAAVADLTATDTALAGRIATIEGKEAGWNAKYDAYTPGGIPIDSLSAETQLEIFAGRQAYDALSEKQDKLTAGENITIEGSVISATGGSSANAVLYTAQTLNDAQKTQARSNIGAASLSDIGTVFTVKGEVATVADLPASGNAVGDVYYVSSVSAGYIWLETTDHPSGYWEELGEPIDLSAYRTAAAQDIIDAAQDTAIAAKYTKPSGGIPASDLASGVIPSVPVQSVNGQTGTVVLDAADVGAEPAVTEITISSAGAVTQALDAGKIYHFTGALTSLTLTFNVASGVPAQYHFDFTEGSTAFDPTLPSGVILPDNHTWEADTRYEVDILNNYAVVIGWAVTV